MLTIDPKRSLLLVVDFQARLMPAIHDADNVVRRIGQLGTAAREMGVHVIGTEQNPDGLGPIVPALARLCDTVLSKFHFSAVAEEGFLRRLPAGIETVVAVGCEAHVCVLQTVHGLLERGLHVKWIADAVGSRHPADRLTATERARDLGADILTTEMVVFEWMATSRHVAFKTLSKLIR